MKFKFVKPFSTFTFNPEYYFNTTLKERWIHALHDPGYLLVFGSIIIFFIVTLIFLV